MSRYLTNRLASFPFSLISGVACVLAASTCLAEDPSSPISAGEKLFIQYCSSCHGNEGKGNGPVAAQLKTPPLDLQKISSRRGGQFPAAEIATIIDGRTLVSAHGSRTMPVWGREFTASFGADSIAEDANRGYINELIEYLKRIQKP